jgi:hypothetical protein
VATRKWALDLIDANAGGVKFSEEARAQLLKKPLDFTGKWGDTSYTWGNSDRELDDGKPTSENLVPLSPAAVAPK